MGVTRLQFDAAGFVRELGLRAPSMGIDLDSRTASTKLHEITGRTYYQETMGRAVPGPPETRDLGVMCPAGSC